MVTARDRADRAPASMTDVATLAGVSVGTVSNVLNRPDKVSAATAARVRRVISELGYVRNDAARQLRAGRSRAVGLIILDVRNPFFAELARGAEDAAASAQLSVLLGNSDKRRDREDEYLTLFEEQRVQGVLISPVDDATTRLKRLRQRGIPAVLVDRVASDHSFSAVSVDDVAGGQLAAQHLLETGRRHIAFIGGPTQLRQINDRITGAKDALANWPASRDVHFEVIEVTALTITEGHRAGQLLADRPSAQRPDGVFAGNDLVAIGLLQALIAAGIRVPTDIGLIGYDDIPFAQAAVVPLSSIRQPAEDIGAEAMQILLAHATDSGIKPRHVVFQPDLVVRASTAAIV